MDWKFIIFSLVKIAIVVGVVQGLVAAGIAALGTFSDYCYQAHKKIPAVDRRKLID